MESDPVIQQFLDDICLAFPEIRPLMDAHEPYMTPSKMEAFANATTEAFAQKEIKRARAYVRFMSARLDQHNKKQFEYIDVYYVENLFWPRGTAADRIGWPLMPANLKALYVRFHGKPPI